MDTTIKGLNISKEQMINVLNEILNINLKDCVKFELEKQNYNVILPDFPVRDEISVEEYFNVFDRYQSYFNKDLIVVAHSIGNPMFIKYISKNNLIIGQYISLAGFSKDYYNEGKEVLNEKVK